MKVVQKCHEVVNIYHFMAFFLFGAREKEKAGFRRVVFGVAAGFVWILFLRSAARVRLTRGFGVNIRHSGCGLRNA